MYRTLNIPILICFVILLLQIKFYWSEALLLTSVTSPHVQVVDFIHSNNSVNGVYSARADVSIPDPVLALLLRKWPFGHLNPELVDKYFKDDQWALYVAQSAQTDKYHWALFNSEEYIAHGNSQSKDILMYDQDGKQFGIINGGLNISDISSYSFTQITHLESLYNRSTNLDALDVKQTHVNVNLARQEYPFYPFEYKLDCWANSECVAVRGAYQVLPNDDQPSNESLRIHYDALKSAWCFTTLDINHVVKYKNSKDNGYYFFIVSRNGQTPRYNWAIVSRNESHVRFISAAPSSDVLVYNVTGDPLIVLQNAHIQNEGFGELWKAICQLKQVLTSWTRALEQRKVLINNPNVFIHANKPFPVWRLYTLCSLSVGFVLMICGVLMPKIANCICEWEEDDSHNISEEKVLQSRLSRVLPSVSVTEFRSDYNFPRSPQQIRGGENIKRHYIHGPRNKQKQVVIPHGIASNI